VEIDAMMRRMTIGDTVRVTARNRVRHYQPGDRGRILSGPEVLFEGGMSYYLVAMDDDDTGGWIVFAEDEIEVDP
jgi:hypothetical protein